MMYFARWQVVLILAVLTLGTIFAIPNLLPGHIKQAIPAWLPHPTVSLGLDLQGGSYLLLQADTDSLVHERLQTVVDDFRAALRTAKIGYSDIGIKGHAAVVKLLDPTKIDAVRPALETAAGGTDFAVSADGVVSATLNDVAVQAMVRTALANSIEVVRRRVDSTGTVEPTIQLQGGDRILLELPGLSDPEKVKALLGTTAKMSFRFVDESVTPEQIQTGTVPPTDDLLPLASAPIGGEKPAYAVQKRVMVSGENLKNASSTKDQNGEWVVAFNFDSTGGKKFCDATTANVGKLFAIVLDNKVISAPVIRDAICGGSGQISGNFTPDSSQQLAVLMNSGALPVQLKIIEERTVGPNLGADSIRAGVYACAIGFVLVTVYMVLAYGLFGIFADIALLFNLILTIAILSVFGATLTLPGIAGMLLTLGMSVDANVLINERIREETKLGRTPVAALDAGFRRAFGTIFDANCTTIIKMIILYILGTGPVKGFAVTIMIGIVTSMFTAIVFVRWLISLWLRRRRPKALRV
jgi:preprotein translocase subunit SecD